MKKKVALKEYVDSKNIEILNYNIDGHISAHEKIYNDNIKNCKSVLITIIKVGSYHYTFEIQEQSNLLQIDGKKLYADVDKKEGYIQMHNIDQLGGEIKYAFITVRR